MPARTCACHEPAVFGHTSCQPGWQEIPGRLIWDAGIDNIVSVSVTIDVSEALQAVTDAEAALNQITANPATPPQRPAGWRRIWPQRKDRA